MTKYSLLNQEINTSFINIETNWAGMRSHLPKKQIGHPVPDSFCHLIKGETLYYYQNTKQAKLFCSGCSQAVLQNQKLLLAIKKNTTKFSNMAIRLARKYFPLPQLSDKEIIKLLIMIRGLQMNFATWGMAVAFSDINGQISDKIMGIFSRRSPLKYPAGVYLETLINDMENNLTTRAHREIALSKNDKYLKNKYFWLDQGYIGRGLSLKQIKDIRQQAVYIDTSKGIKKNILLRELALTTTEKKY